MAVYEDVTERKHTEEALFQEKECAQVTLQAIGDAVMTTDIEGRVAYMNPVAEALTGCSLEEASSQPLDAVLHLWQERNRKPIADSFARYLTTSQNNHSRSYKVLRSCKGQEYVIEDCAAPIHDRAGALLGLVLVFRDVTEARRIVNEMSHQASHDALTGLLNRRAFEQRLRRVLKTARARQTQHALCYLDLDQFKLINDSCGHTAGDALLGQVGRLLQAKIRKRDTLARLGGDEFGVLLELCTLEHACRVARVLREVIEDFRFLWEGKTFNIGVSIGLVPITETSESLISVLRAADAACYLAKDRGRNCIHVFREDDAALAKRHREMQWISQLPQALEENRFRLCFQPIVPITAAAHPPLHYELLLRLENQAGQLVPPGAFLPAAERYQLATKLDVWVVRRVFSWLRRHPLHLVSLYLPES